MQPCYSVSANPAGKYLNWQSNIHIPIYIFRLCLGTLLAVGSLKGYVSIWNLKTGSLVRKLYLHLFVPLS